MNTTTTIRLRPRWWQFIRRFREWRARKELIGQQLIIDGQPVTIVEWTGNSVVTVADPRIQSSDVVRF